MVTEDLDSKVINKRYNHKHYNWQNSPFTSWWKEKRRKKGGCWDSCFEQGNQRTKCLFLTWTTSSLPSNLSSCPLILCPLNIKVKWSTFMNCFKKTESRFWTTFTAIKKKALQEKSRDYEYYPGKSTMPPIL